MTVKATDASFEQEVLKSNVPVLVDFTATWCGPCKALAPIVDQLANDLDGTVKVGKLDTEASRSAAMKYRINMLPTIIEFKSCEVVHKFIGLTQKGEFQQVLNGLVGSPATAKA